MADLEVLLADLRSGEEELVHSTFTKLKTLGLASLPSILKVLQNEDPELRWWAVAALAHIREARARQGLIQGLLDPDPSVRQCAAAGLQLQPEVKAIPALARLLEDEDRLTARLAGNALSAIGTAAIEGLGELLRSKPASVRIEAARALSHIDDPAVIPVLFSALEDPSALVVYFAEEGLARQKLDLVYFKP